MPAKRKDREKVQCMTCDLVINGDERANHKKKVHKGDPNVKFKNFMETSAKQPKLSFGSSSKSKVSDEQFKG